MDKSVEKTKELIEGIIGDLSHNISITQIFNKVQVLASYLNNDTFSSWVNNERMGYNDVNQLPEYRKTTVDILVDGRSGIYSLTKYPIPRGALGDGRIESMMRTYYCFDKISSLVPFIDAPEGSNNIVLPAISYSELRKIFPMGDVNVAYHRVPNLFFSGIVDAVNSKLLEFLLEINNEMDINADFNIIDKKNLIDMISNRTINSGVINIAGGNINIENSTVIGGEDMSIQLPIELTDKIIGLLMRLKN